MASTIHLMKFAVMIIITSCLSASVVLAGKCDPKADKCSACTKCSKCAPCSTAGGQACSVKRDELARHLPFWKRLLLR
jgi:hypothetical protein